MFTAEHIIPKNIYPIRVVVPAKTESQRIVQNKDLVRGETESVITYTVEEIPIEEITTKANAQEIEELKANLKSALVWQFRMIEALWETGVTKGIWGASDIANVELKQKYVEWKTKLTRLAELGE